MLFSDILNAAVSKDNDRPLMQKESYPVSAALDHYLKKYKRDIRLPVNYTELFHYSHTNSIKDKNGKPTHWENVVYEKKVLEELKEKLVSLWLLLDPNPGISIGAIDFCEYANSMPFRVTVTDKSTGNNQQFYIKAADASRIYGLELEELLSPNKTAFFYHHQTLVENHIAGIPGDNFLSEMASLSEEDEVNIAQEFVRFNERSFVRLLGDMRSYNFVVKQESGSSYRLRSIDFDQQCYEGRMNLYLPQFYKENYAYVQLVNKLIGKEAIEQIRITERNILAQLALKNKQRLTELLEVMVKEELSENYKVTFLKKELGEVLRTNNYQHCKSMGSIVKQHIKQVLQVSL